MAGLEGIVRPFQRPDTLARRRLVAKRQDVTVSPATISWGQAGTLPAAHQIEAIDDTGLNFTVIMDDEKYTELNRKTDVRRITQTLPNGTTNPDNYVDLDRPYQVTFRKEDPASARRNETQVWSTAFDTATFRTISPENKGIKSRFHLDRSLA